MKLGVKATVNGGNIEAVSTLANEVSAKKLDNGNSGNWERQLVDRRQESGLFP
jgi:hypothetical protein